MSNQPVEAQQKPLEVQQKGARRPSRKHQPLEPRLGLPAAEQPTLSVSGSSAGRALEA
jgi:hypothetical protein